MRMHNLSVHQLADVTKWGTHGQDRNLAEGNPLDIPTSNFPYAVTLLLLVFAAIMLGWEVLIGTLSWLMASWMHLKRVLVDRLKEELLALGIVSLVVAFATSSLGKICRETLDYLEASDSELDPLSNCPPGTEPLFPPSVISTSHYLLFWIAVTQIGYMLLSATFTAYRFHHVLHWERGARSNTVVKSGKRKGLLPSHLNVSLRTLNTTRPPTGATPRAVQSQDAVAGADTPTQAPGAEDRDADTGRAGALSGFNERWHALAGSKHQWTQRCLFACQYTWLILMGGLSQDVYSALRKLLLLRVQCDLHSQELRTVNLAVASEQLMHQDVSYVHAHTWLQVISIAALMLYPEVVLQIIWINGPGLVVLIIVSYKLQSITRRAIHMIETQLPSSLTDGPPANLGLAQNGMSSLDNTLYEGYTRTSLNNNNGVPTPRSPALSLAGSETPSNIQKISVPALPRASTGAQGNLAASVPAGGDGLQAPDTQSQGPGIMVVTVPPFQGTSITVTGPPQALLQAVAPAPTQLHLGSSPAHAAYAAMLAAAGSSAAAAAGAEGGGEQGANGAESGAPAVAEGDSGFLATLTSTGQQSTSPAGMLKKSSSALKRWQQLRNHPSIKRPEHKHVVHVAQLLTMLTHSGAGFGDASALDLARGDALSPRGASRQGLAPQGLPQGGEGSRRTSREFRPLSARSLPSFDYQAPDLGTASESEASVSRLPSQASRSRLSQRSGSFARMGSERFQYPRLDEPDLATTSGSRLIGRASRKPALPTIPQAVVASMAAIPSLAAGANGSYNTGTQPFTLDAARLNTKPPLSLDEEAVKPHVTLEVELSDAAGQDPQQTAAARPAAHSNGRAAAFAFELGGLGVGGDSDQAPPARSNGGRFAARVRSITGWWNHRRSLAGRPAPDDAANDSSNTPPASVNGVSASGEAAKAAQGQWARDATTSGTPFKAQASLQAHDHPRHSGVPGSSRSPSYTDYSRATTGGRLEGELGRVSLGRVSVGAIGATGRMVNLDGDATSWAVAAGARPTGLQRMPTMHQNPGLVVAVAALEHQLLELFWFKSPRLLLWVMELVIVCNASVLTLCFYYMARYHQYDLIGNHAVIITLAVYNILVAVYIGWVVFPQYAIVTTAVSTSTSRMLHQLKWANVVAEEEEKGVAGMTSGLLNKLYWMVKQRKRRGVKLRRYRLRKEARQARRTSHHAAPIDAMTSGGEDRCGNDIPCVLGRKSPLHPDVSLPGCNSDAGSMHGRAHGHVREKAAHATRTRLMNAWVAALALRSGVILPAEHVATAQAHLSRHAPLFLGIVATWRHKTLVAQGYADPPEGGYAVSGGVWLAAFRDAFDELDVDGTGSLGTDELQEYLREGFNIRATYNELKAMLWSVCSRVTTVTAPSAQPAAEPQDTGILPSIPAALKATFNTLMVAVDGAQAALTGPQRLSSPEFGGSGGLDDQGGNVTVTDPVPARDRTSAPCILTPGFQRTSGLQGPLVIGTGQGSGGAVVGGPGGVRGNPVDAVAVNPSPQQRPDAPRRRTSLVTFERTSLSRKSGTVALDGGAAGGVAAGVVIQGPLGGVAAGGVVQGPLGGAGRTTSGVSFHTFVLFAAFAFLDPLKKGVLDVHHVSDVLRANDWLLPDVELAAMINLALAEDATQVGAVQFLRLFQDVDLLEE